MKIVFISDTHGFENKINLPIGDVLVHSGDATLRGTEGEIWQFNQWLGTIKDQYQHVVVIAGNHDKLFERNNALARLTLTNATYLQDSGVEIEGVKFWGSPWTPAFGHGWVFNANRHSHIKRFWDEIPLDTNVLITHGPPYGQLDTVARGKVGCEALADRIELLTQLKIHAFGHIHEGYGTKEVKGVKYINAASVNVMYEPVNDPIVVEL